jgi:hypothetical protein
MWVARDGRVRQARRAPELTTTGPAGLGTKVPHACDVAHGVGTTPAVDASPCQSPRSKYELYPQSVQSLVVP